MAGWDRYADWDRDVLERMVGLLFALAGLADLAAGLACHRRRHVLGILSYGEAEARAFLIGMADGAPAPADAPEMVADAALLAARLRVLALLLYAMLARAAMSALPGAIGSQAGRPSREISGPVLRWLAQPPPAPDTS